MYLSKKVFTQIKAKYSVKIATKSDKKALKRFYKNQHYSASFIGFDSAYIILDNEQIIASAIVSYSTSDNNQALLHALVVAKPYQKQGIATELINIIKQQHCHNHSNKHSSIVCFTKPELAIFYQALSFKKLTQEQAPNSPIISDENNLITDVNFKRFNAYRKKNPALTVCFFSEGF